MGRREYIKVNKKGLARGAASANAAHPEVAPSAATALQHLTRIKITYEWRKRGSMALGPTRMVCGPRPVCMGLALGPGTQNANAAKEHAERIRAAGR